MVEISTLINPCLLKNNLRNPDFIGVPGISPG